MNPQQISTDGIGDFGLKFGNKKTMKTNILTTKKYWLSDNFKKMVLPYTTNKTAKGTVREFVLPRNMSDSQIQKELSSTTIPVEILANFIEKNCKDKSKWYIMHVQVLEEVVAMCGRWGGDEWNVYAFGWGEGGYWSTGGLYLSFATLENEHLSSDTLTLGNLDASKRVKVLEKKYDKLIDLVEKIQSILANE